MYELTSEMCSKDNNLSRDREREEYDDARVHGAMDAEDDEGGDAEEECEGSEREGGFEACCEWAGGRGGCEAVEDGCFFVVFVVVV